MPWARNLCFISFCWPEKNNNLTNAWSVSKILWTCTFRLQKNYNKSAILVRNVKTISNQCNSENLSLAMLSSIIYYYQYRSKSETWCTHEMFFVNINQKSEYFVNCVRENIHSRGSCVKRQLSLVRHTHIRCFWSPTTTILLLFHTSLITNTNTWLGWHSRATVEYSLCVFSPQVIFSLYTKQIWSETENYYQYIMIILARFYSPYEYKYACSKHRKTCLI